MKIHVLAIHKKLHTVRDYRTTTKIDFNTAGTKYQLWAGESHDDFDIADWNIRIIGVIES